MKASDSEKTQSCNLQDVKRLNSSTSQLELQLSAKIKFMFTVQFSHLQKDIAPNGSVESICYKLQFIRQMQMENLKKKNV